MVDSGFFALRLVPDPFTASCRISMIIINETHERMRESLEIITLKTGFTLI